MIEALTSSRIRLSSELYEMHNKLCDLCNYSCLTDKDAEDLDNALQAIDRVVNRVMTDKRKK